MTVRTDGGDATVQRDSNCSLGPAASGPPAMPGVPAGPTGAPVGGSNFNVVPGTAMTPQECAALGVPPGTKWGASNKPSEDVPYAGPYGGSNAGESFLSI